MSHCDTVSRCTARAAVLAPVTAARVTTPDSWAERPQPAECQNEVFAKPLLDNSQGRRKVLQGQRWPSSVVVASRGGTGLGTQSQLKSGQASRPAGQTAKFSLQGPQYDNSKEGRKEPAGSSNSGSGLGVLAV